MNVYTQTDWADFNHLSIQEVTEHIDYPNRGENLVVNSAMIDSNSDGLADDWDKKYSTGVYTIVTGNGFEGNAQRYEWGQQYGGVSQVSSYSSNKFTYFVKYKYRTNSASLSVMVSNANGGALPVNTGNAIEIIRIIEPILNVDKFVVQLNSGAGAGEWFEISDYKVYKLEYSNTIGHRPHLVFNLFCMDGNTQGYPQWYTIDIQPYINYDNIYEFSAELIALLLANPDWMNEEIRAYVYWFFKTQCGNTLTDVVVYGNQMYEYQQTIINTLKGGKIGCPTYDGLPTITLITDTNNVAVTSSNGTIITL